MTPKHVFYIDSLYRIMSFDSGWPNIVNSLLMAEAGFFFSGSNDEVVCFQCGSLLHNWQTNDEPWARHFIANPNCFWVKSNMTEEKWRQILGLIIMSMPHIENFDYLIFRLNVDYNYSNM